MGALTAILGVAVTIYFPIELAACAVLVPAYTAALKKVNRKFIAKPVKTDTDKGVVNDNLS